MSPISVQQQNGAVTFVVRVHPGARQERVAGVLGDALKLDVTARPFMARPTKPVYGFSPIF